MMVITNQENDQFNDELGRIILNDMDIQNAFLNNVTATAKNMVFETFILILNIFGLKIKMRILNF